MKTLQAHIDDLLEQSPELTGDSTGVARSWFKFTFSAGAIAAMRAMAEGGNSGELCREANAMIVEHMEFMDSLTPSRSVH